MKIWPLEKIGKASLDKEYVVSQDGRMRNMLREWGIIPYENTRAQVGDPVDREL